MYPRSEILFPRSCIRGLRPLLDDAWARLVDRILAQSEDDEESLAFTLMIIRLCGCLNCEMGGYKASLGCNICSQRTVAGVKGGGAAMLKRLEKARQELQAYRAGRPCADPEPDDDPDAAAE